MKRDMRASKGYGWMYGYGYGYGYYVCSFERWIMIEMPLSTKMITPEL